VVALAEYAIVRPRALIVVRSTTASNSANVDASLRRNATRCLPRGVRICCCCQFPDGTMIKAIQINQEPVMEFLRLVRIVLSSFFGVRKRASHEADFANVNMVLLPFVAVLLAACFGAILFGVVHLIAHSTNAMQGF
jgi:Protein of unknown function (DUF2970)